MEIYNTLTKRKEEFKPLEPGKVKMYVCGPTVYNYIHIGNARPMIVFDTVRRYMEYKGYDVNYVSNFTEGSISIIDKRIFKLVKTIYIGGMPKGILKKDNRIYIGDYLKGRLIVVEGDKVKKIIAIESEPNAMILF